MITTVLQGKDPRTRSGKEPESGSGSQFDSEIAETLIKIIENG
jgi:hypothetical protein